MGLKNILLAKTRGTIIMHHVFKAYEPAEERDLMVSPHGSLVAYEDGNSTGYAIFMTQERGTMFIGPAWRCIVEWLSARIVAMKTWT